MGHDPQKRTNSVKVKGAAGVMMVACLALLSIPQNAAFGLDLGPASDVATERPVDVGHGWFGYGDMEPAAREAAGAVWEPWMDGVRPILESAPGFLGGMPYLDGAQKTLRLFFSGPAPSTLASLVPPDWKLEVLADLPATPTTADLPPGIYIDPNETFDPTQDNFTIGPGALLAVKKAAGVQNIWNGCTANWLWKDQGQGQASKLYLGTAGHCVVGQGQATHGPGNNTDAAAVRVYVCPNPCPVGGAVGEAAANAVGTGPVKANWVLLGKVAYARLGPAFYEDDFALIEIPPALYPMLDPKIPVWGGPTGPAPTIHPGDLLATHGNALGLGETYATKSRRGVFTFTTGSRFIATLWGSHGDSGAPAGLIPMGAPADDFQIGAAAILTACFNSDTVCQTGVAPPGPHPFTGPTFPYLLTLARQANLCLHLVNETENPVEAAAGVC